IVRAPLSRVPENTLKFTVGLLLASFGTFWSGEGAGVSWPGGDGALIGILALLLLTSLAAVRVLRHGFGPAGLSPASKGADAGAACGRSPASGIGSSSVTIGSSPSVSRRRSASPRCWQTAAWRRGGRCRSR